MSKANGFETALLQHIFQNAAIANIGDASGLQPSAAAGSLYVSLHTADPGEAGDQTTNECTYGSYARRAVARSAGGWNVSGNQADNVAQISWPQATSGSETATHFGIGIALSGAGVLLFSGALSASLAISTGITPQAAASALTVTED